MTTIAQIIRNGRGRAGSNGSWRIETRVYLIGDIQIPTVELWHYSTLMLSWSGDGDGIFYCYTCLGHGSVSDQGGMNTAFRILNIPLRYDRDYRGGGPRITRLSDDFNVVPREVPSLSLSSSVFLGDAMRWNPQEAEDEIAEWRKILSKGGD